MCDCVCVCWHYSPDIIYAEVCAAVLCCAELRPVCVVFVVCCVCVLKAGRCGERV